MGAANTALVNVSIHQYFIAVAIAARISDDLQVQMLNIVLIPVRIPVTQNNNKQEKVPLSNGAIQKRDSGLWRASNADPLCQHGKTLLTFNAEKIIHDTKGIDAPGILRIVDIDTRRGEVQFSSPQISHARSVESVVANSLPTT